MPLVGFGVAFLGYSLFYYGLTQVRGQNYGLLDLVIPGRFAKAANNPPDSSATASADVTPTTTPTPSTAPASSAPSGPVAAPQPIPSPKPGSFYV
jgi:hypothetical protein